MNKNKISWLLGFITLIWAVWSIHAWWTKPVTATIETRKVTEHRKDSSPSSKKEAEKPAADNTPSPSEKEDVSSTSSTSTTSTTTEETADDKKADLKVITQFEGWSAEPSKDRQNIIYTLMAKNGENIDYLPCSPAIQPNINFVGGGLIYEGLVTNSKGETKILSIRRIARIGHPPFSKKDVDSDTWEDIDFAEFKRLAGYFKAVRPLSAFDDTLIEGKIVVPAQLMKTSWWTATVNSSKEILREILK